ncbi:MAG: aminotransferase class V-fold PLP-dependent enzyme [Firmicutes bacterium]|nr:aminotransferase class V-fold PLP-dependent enzyme [Bacillota bacterium]
MLDMHYFDNAATSWPKLEEVYRATDKFMREVGANPGRSGHCLSKQADTIVEETRQLLADFFGAPDPRLVAFTFNGTDGLNLVIKGLLAPGDHAVTSNTEHNSVSRPLRRLERQGVDVTYLQADKEGRLSAEELAAVMRPETKLVIINHASNVLGYRQDAAALAKVAHEHGALFALDAAQTAGHYPIDMQALGIDILVVPGHKGLLGPYGTGAVITLRDVGILPWRDGGTGTKSDARMHPDELPYRLEGRTLNAAGIAGLGAAIKFINNTGLDKIMAKEKTDMEQLLACLQAEERVILYGPTSAEQRAGLVSFNIEGLSADELAQIMNDKWRIAGRPGLHCSPLSHRAVGTFPNGSYRLSPGYFTPPESLETVCEAIRQICRS